MTFGAIERPIALEVVFLLLLNLCILHSMKYPAK